jgi:hypothetical protein
MEDAGGEVENPVIDKLCAYMEAATCQFKFRMFYNIFLLSVFGV